MVKIIENSGKTMEEAIVILEAENNTLGIKYEYLYLSRIFGIKNQDWKLKSQSLHEKNGKMYDRMDIILNDSSEKTLFFDITDFFGKGLGF